MLLAGVTVLAHGLAGNVDGWIDAAAHAIADRIGGNVPIFTMIVARTDWQTRDARRTAAIAAESSDW